MVHLSMRGRYQNPDGGSNLQLNMHKLHKSGQHFFLFYGNEIRTCATVKDHIEDKIFKILCTFIT